MLAQNDLQQSLSKGQEQFMKIFTNAADFMDLDDNSRSSALTGTTVNVLVERLVSKDNHPRTFGWLFQCNEFPTESKDQLEYMTTEDFLVICCNGNIYFNDLEELLTGKRQQRKLDLEKLEDIKFDDFELPAL